MWKQNENLKHIILTWELQMPWFKVDSFIKSLCCKPKSTKNANPTALAKKQCGLWLLNQEVFKTEIDSVNNSDFAAQYRALCGLKISVVIFFFFHLCGPKTLGVSLN